MGYLAVDDSVAAGMGSVGEGGSQILSLDVSGMN
jgi:hypothetical protein